MALLNIWANDELCSPLIVAPLPIPVTYQSLQNKMELLNKSCYADQCLLPAIEKNLKKFKMVTTLEKYF